MPRLIKLPLLLIAAALSLGASVTVRADGPAGAPSAETRATTADGSQLRVLADVPYAQDDLPGHRLDLYLPVAGTAPRPLVVLIHGGGWSGGDKASFRGAAMACVANGYAVASLNYRLAGQQARFPAQILDCKRAIAWLRAHAAIYGYDPARFVAAGHSAGSHLAALVGATNGYKPFDADVPAGGDSSVQAVLWTAGVADFVAMCATPGCDLWLSPTNGAAALLGDIPLVVPKAAAAASPVTYVGAGTVPMILFHGDKDPLVPVSQAVEMYAALARNGAPAELHILRGADHSGPGYWSPSFFDQANPFLAKALHVPAGTLGHAAPATADTAYATTDFPRDDYAKLVAGKPLDSDTPPTGTALAPVMKTVESLAEKASVGGIDGIRMVKATGITPRYLYFDAPADLKNAAVPHVAVTVVYQDAGPSVIDLAYDSSDSRVTVSPKAPGAWKSMGLVKVEGTGQWRTAQFEIRDANFAGRLNGHDIRIQWPQDIDGVIGSVSVRPVR